VHFDGGYAERFFGKLRDLSKISVLQNALKKHHMQ